MLKSAQAFSIPIVILSLAGCTTSGSNRLDQAGDDLSNATGYQVTQKQSGSNVLIGALKGGLIGRIPGLKLDDANRARALEAEYRALETAPAGQGVDWKGGADTGEVVAAVPYQVGSQNCRQYTHTVKLGSATPLIARGAACRNADGSWTPLS